MGTGNPQVRFIAVPLSDLDGVGAFSRESESPQKLADDGETGV